MEIIKKIQELKTAKTTTELSQALYKHYMVVVGEEPNTTNKRVKFYLKSSNTNTYDPLQDHANGLVFDRCEKPLMIPGKHISQLPKVPAAGKLGSLNVEANFTACALVHGTFISAYYYDNRWVLCTVHGIDNNNTVLNDAGITVQQIFEDVLRECKIAASFDEFTAELDKECSYSFIVKHPGLHLHSAGPSHLIYCNYAINTTTLAEVKLPSSVGSQPELKLPEGITASTINKLLDMPEGPPDFPLGILLHAKPGAVLPIGVPPAMLVRSQMMREILEFTNAPDLRELLSENKHMKYADLVVLRGCMMPTRRIRFRSLFPSKWDMCEQIEQQLSKLGHAILQLYVKQKTMEIIPTPENELALRLQSEIANAITIDPESPDAHLRIMQFITDKRYVAMLYSHVFDA